MMTPEERETMNVICSLLQVEKNPGTLCALLKQLNDLLKHKQPQLENHTQS